MREYLDGFLEGFMEKSRSRRIAIGKGVSIMANAAILAMLKFRDEAELNQIKNAIDTFKAYNIVLEGLNVTEVMVQKEIANKTKDR